MNEEKDQKHNKLVNFCNKFSYGLHIVVVMGLVGLSLAIVGLFISEVSHIFTGDVERGVITALGTMLVLWVMIELMATEIDYLKGGKFSLIVFAEVGLVAFIRDALVASLHHENVNKLMVLAGIVLMMSIVYWLIAKTEHR